MTLELEEVRRQTDPHFISVLQAVRLGTWVGCCGVFRALHRCRGDERYPAGIVFYFVFMSSILNILLLAGRCSVAGEFLEGLCMEHFEQQGYHCQLFFFADHRTCHNALQSVFGSITFCAWWSRRRRCHYHLLWTVLGKLAVFIWFSLDWLLHSWFGSHSAQRSDFRVIGTFYAIWWFSLN